MELLREGDVIRRAEWRIAQRGKGEFGHAVLRRGEHAHHAPVAKSCVHGRRVLPSERGEARGGRLCSRLTEGAQVQRLICRLADRSVVDLLASRVARRLKVHQVAQSEHSCGEARLRVLAVQHGFGKLIGGPIACGDEHPASLEEPVEHTRSDRRVRHIHHLHLVEAEHPCRYRPPSGVLHEGIRRRRHLIERRRHVGRRTDAGVGGTRGSGSVCMHDGG